VKDDVSESEGFSESKREESEGRRRMTMVWSRQALRRCQDL